MNIDLAKRRDASIARGVGMMTQIYAERALNSEIWDVEGRRYIDFASGIAVLNTGHRHPRIMAAISDQLGKFTHSCHQVLPYENYVRLGERLNHLVPAGEENKTLFVTTGAEAVENAIKIARCATGRSAVISFSGGFHGRTFMGMALTGKTLPYKAGFGPMVSDVFHAPYPVPLHGLETKDSLAALDKLFRADVEPGRVAAIILEPVQGEGGFYEAPADFVEAIRALCDEHGIVMIADEIQTGFARTGKMFAMEHHKVRPDLVTMAKSLAGGMPLAAVTGRADLVDAPAPGGLGGTYGGNPVAISAAHAVLDVIEEEGLCERANVLGAQLRQRLDALRGDVAQIADIRGPGFMVAVEFSDPDSGQPDPAFTVRVREAALRRGLVLLSCGIYGNVIRFLAPLTIEQGVFEEALEIIGESVREAAP